MKKGMICHRGLLYAAAAAFVTLMICSKSSPLYPLNDWVDANTYLTVGRGMLHGKLPYRDLYEHKGPLLYMLHAAAAAVSRESFLGVFIIELIACTAFLYEAKVLLGGKQRIWLLPLIAGAVYASKAFCHGDSAEELCLPLTLGAYMIGLKTVRGENTLDGRKWFLLGILGGAVFWVKYTFTGVISAAAGAGIFAAVRRGKAATLVQGISLCVLGGAAASLPVIVYFGVNGAISDLFSVYFYDNLFRYTEPDGSFFNHLTDGLNFCLLFMTVPFILVCTGLMILALRGEYAILAYYSASLVLMILSVFGGHSSFQYYPLAMAAFVPQSVCAIADAAEKYSTKLSFSRRTEAVLAAVSIVICGAWCYGTIRNVYLMKCGRDELPQYRFADMIEENGGGRLLNYGFIDGGFYLTAGQVPEFRYFCLNNMDNPEMAAAQDYYVSSGMADFVVTRSSEPVSEFSFPGYVLIGREEMCYYDKKFYYFLFKYAENDANNLSAIE